MLTGTRIGPYEIAASIGAGGMGEVFRARDTRLNRDVAVKVLPRDFVADAERMRRFEQEAKTLAALNHPNILTIHDAGVYEGAPYLVSELLDGRTLREEMNGGALPARKATDYALQIAHGLAAAHGKGVIHRDLKPENIFITNDRRVKILDFGLAKLRPNQGPESGKQKVGHSETIRIDEEAIVNTTEPGMVLGTPAYMSPEQVRGEPADHRADIFAFGALLYEMLSGTRAFRRSTPIESMNAVLNETVADLSAAAPNTPPGVARIVERCLEKQRDNRFQSAKDLAFALAESSSVRRAPSSARRSRHAGPKRTLMAGALILAAGVGAWMFFKSGIQGHTSRNVSSSGATHPVRQEKSIAVLAFANLSEDKSNEYFSDGVSEELLNVLAKVPGLKVSARSSAFSFKGTNIPIPEIARKLGVAYVVEGSVRRSGSRVRIGARLINAEDGLYVWSDHFDRDLKDIFAVQDEIAALIAKNLSLKMGVTQTEPRYSGSTINLAAYEAFLRGRTAWNSMTTEGNRDAVKYFMQALALDSQYALAHGALAEAYISLANDGQEPAEKMFPLARASARQALTLDERIVQAHTALAEYEFHYVWNWAESEEHLQRALAINPNYATAHARRSGHLHCWGRHEEALTAARRASELDPLGRNIDLADSYIVARHYAEAIAAAQNSILLDPKSRVRRGNLGLALFLAGQTEAGLKVMEELTNEIPDDISVSLGWAYGRTGRVPEARSILQEMLARSETNFVSPLKIAKVAIGIGDKAFAFTQLERAYAIRDPMLPQIGMEPFYDPIRDDPRFRDLLRRLKLDSYFPENGRP